MAKIKALLKKYSQITNERFFEDVVIKQEYKHAFNKKADVIIDVGALAGEFGVYMYGKAKIIHAIEPYSKAYEELTSNIRDFNLKKIKPYRLALSNYNGEGSLVISEGRGGNKLVVGDGSDKTEKVEVKTLARFIKDENIERVDILKIDIENTEYEVFTAPDFKEIADRIDFIIGEHANEEVAHTLRMTGFDFMRTPRGFYAKRK